MIKLLRLPLVLLLMLSLMPDTAAAEGGGDLVGRTATLALTRRAWPLVTS